MVMEIEQFNVMTKLLETMEDEDIREAAQLAGLPIFRNAVEKGLQAIREQKTRPWREKPLPTFEVSFTEPFERCLLKLKRKYRRLRGDMEDLSLFLEQSPYRGNPIPGYAHKVWKIRWPGRDMAVGKRGGFRAIYYWKKPETTVYCF